MALTRFKFNLIFVVDVNDITRETVDKNYRSSKNYQELVNDPLTFEIAQRQRNLLHALIDDKSALRNYVKRCFADSIEYEARSLFKEYFCLGTEHFSPEKELEPVLKTLSKQDQEFFEKMAEYEVFIEHIDHFLDSFEVRLVDAAVAEVE